MKTFNLKIALFMLFACTAGLSFAKEKSSKKISSAENIMAQVASINISIDKLALLIENFEENAATMNQDEFDRVKNLLILLINRSNITDQNSFLRKINRIKAAYHLANSMDEIALKKDDDDTDDDIDFALTPQMILASDAYQTDYDADDDADFYDADDDTSPESAKIISTDETGRDPSVPLAKIISIDSSDQVDDDTDDDDDDDDDNIDTPLMAEVVSTDDDDIDPSLPLAKVISTDGVSTNQPISINFSDLKAAINKLKKDAATMTKSELIAAKNALKKIINNSNFINKDDLLQAVEEIGIIQNKI